MYVVIAKDGTQFYGREKTFDAARFDFKEHGGIASIGLTDGHHILQQFTGGDGYHYHAEAVAAVRNAVGPGPTSAPPPKVVAEEIAVYIKPETFAVKANQQITDIGKCLAEASETLRKVKASNMPQDKKNQAIAQIHTAKANYKKMIERTHADIEQVESEGGIVVSARIETVIEKYTVNGKAPARSQALEQRAIDWVGAAPEIKKQEAKDNDTKTNQ